MKRLLLGLSLLLAAALSTANGQESNLKPYLQASFPTSVVVNWITAGKNTPQVKYGTESGNLTETVTGTSYKFPLSYYYHTVQLEGLTPNTGYYYRIFSGGESSPEHYFRTPSEGKPDHFRFIILGDHQMLNWAAKPYHKYDDLVKAAKAKAEERFGTPLADKVNLVVNDGDQVDWGSDLNQWEKIHFGKLSPLSHELPITTAVGNHDTYGVPSLTYYLEFFAMDEKGFTYQNISSGTERYYTYKNANVLFIVIDSELPHTKPEGKKQLEWLKKVVKAAKSDPQVDWIFTVCHRPYIVEQYANDIFPTYGQVMLPILQGTDKFVMHIAGHHHMYSRGQFINHNAYHIISGGTAWPQYWGDSGNEIDREEVQGTWSNFAYSIVEIDNKTEKMSVQTYSIGSLDVTKDNVLLDEFSYQRNVAAPAQPSITNDLTHPIELPYTLHSSDFVSKAGQKLNSAQFQISSTADFLDTILNRYQHVENWYGALNGRRDETQDIGLGADVINLTIAEGLLEDGVYFIRARHRDANLGWSPWSEPTRFAVGTGVYKFDPKVQTDKPYYAPNESIVVNYRGGADDKNDVIAIFEIAKDVKTLVNAVSDQRTNRKHRGKQTHTIRQQGLYKVAYLQGSAMHFEAKSPFAYFWVGTIPKLTTDKEKYAVGDAVTITMEQQPKQTNDWVGVYRVGIEPKRTNAAATQEVNSANQVKFTNLEPGYYYAQYHLQGEDYIAGEPVKFHVGDEPTTISTNKTTYKENEPIVVSFENGSGCNKDFIGIFIDDGKEENTENAWTFKYFNGTAKGTVSIDGLAKEQGSINQLPTPGRYRIGMYSNDSYYRISNAISIEVTPLPKLAIKVTPPEGGIVTVKNQGKALNDGASLNENDNLTITATANASFTLKALKVNSTTFTSGATYKVAGDVNVEATFEAENSTPTNYPVSFTITDGHKAVKGATVTVRATTLSSDAQGVASLNLPNGDYTYSAQAPGYKEKKGEFKVNGEALTIAVALEAELPGIQAPVESTKLATVTLYPNPTNSVVYVKNLEYAMKLQLFSTTGTLLQAHRSRGERELTLNLKHYPEGMYLLRITDQDGGIRTLYIQKQ